MKIYEPKGRAREYSPLALNYFKGCDNGCAYCYVPGMMTRFNADYKHNKVVAPSSFIELEKSAKKFEEGSMNLLLGTAYDQWQTNGNIPNQDWSFLINLAGKSQEYITPRKLFKHPELRHTKTAFGQHFMENASTSERFPFDKAFFALSRLKMGI